MRRVERELCEYDDELDNESPPAREAGTLQSQLSNIQVSFARYNVMSFVCVTVNLWAQWGKG